MALQWRNISAIVTEIIGFSTVCFIACWWSQEGKLQGFASLTLCEWNSPVITVGFHPQGPVIQEAFPCHYTDAIMSAIVSPITNLTIVYSTVYSDADQRKHRSSASLAFVWGFHRGPVNSPHKWPVTWKMLPFDDVIMPWCHHAYNRGCPGIYAFYDVIITTLFCETRRLVLRVRIIKLIPSRKTRTIKITYPCTCSREWIR